MHQLRRLVALGLYLLPVLAIAAPPRIELILPAESGMVTNAAVEGTLRVSTWDAGTHAYELRPFVTDWAGKEAALPASALTLKGQLVQPFRAPLAGYGPFDLRLELWSTNDTRAVTQFTRRVVRLAPVPRLTAAQRMKSPMGVNGHQGTPWTSMGLMGLHWGRDYSWGWMGHGETAPVGNGVDFARLAKAADAAGVTILPIMMDAFQDKANHKAFIQDAAEIERSFERLGRAFPEIPYWEMENEIDGSWKRETHGAFVEAEYFQFMHHAARGLKAAGHGARVVPNGTAGILVEHTERMLAAVRDDVAVVNYHHYTGTRPPEQAVEDINFGGAERAVAMEFTDRMAQMNLIAHAAGKEAWLTEIGWDVTYGPAVGERLQALYLPRVYLLARLAGTDKVFWFFDRDTPGTQKFASCGLIDRNGQARPSAAACAQLSRETADATIGGHVDLGEDRWCVLLRKPDGSWVAAVWSVEKEWPFPPELAAAPCFDIFGNSVRPKVLGPEIVYAHMKTLPAAWDAQRAVQLMTPRTVTGHPGGMVRTQVQGPGNFKIGWEQLPAGMRMSGTSQGPGGHEAVLTCDADMPSGPRQVVLLAQGMGWTKRWRLTVNVEPAVTVQARAFVPGEPLMLTLTGQAAAAGEAGLRVPEGTGSVRPERVVLAADRPAEATFTATPMQVEPVALTVALTRGAPQVVWLRPGVLRVGPAPETVAIDGAMGEWGDAWRVKPHTFAADRSGFVPDVWVGWRADGLYVAMDVPLKALRSGDPRVFWEWPGIELFVDTGAGTQPWGATVHQFWFTPVESEGQWRLVPGEWKRGAAIPATIYDDARIRTAMAWDGQGMMRAEILLPVAALGGAAIGEGQAWRMAIAVQDVMPLSEMRQAAWPTLKSEGILDGSARWGRVEFEE